MKLNLFASALIIANLAGLYCPTPATAQLVPDTTLGRENTLIAPNENIKGIPSDRIDGGAVVIYSTVFENLMWVMAEQFIWRIPPLRIF